MKTSTLIVAVASVASVLLLAVPKKGAGTDAGTAAPFIPKVSLPVSPQDVAHSERLGAQLLRLSAIDWVRDPFAPIELAPEPPVEDPFPVEPPPPVEEPVEIPEVVVPKKRIGPLPVLSGISQSGAQRFAIVDRIIVREGDPLPTGDVVMSIGHRTVTLRTGEEIVVIRLGDGQ